MPGLYNNKDLVKKKILRKVDLRSFFTTEMSEKKINYQVKNFSSEHNFLHGYKRKQEIIAPIFPHHVEKHYYFLVFLVQCTSRQKDGCYFYASTNQRDATG